MKGRLAILLFIGTLQAGIGFAGNGGGSSYSITFNSEQEETLFRTLVNGNESDILQYFINTTNVDYNPKRLALLQDYLTRWEAEGPSVEILKKVFYVVHRKFLRNYDQYASFAQVFSKGDYDCLTATTLYAYILDRLEFKYEIIETRYHMALLVMDGEEKYLIESTDPIDGLVLNGGEVEKMLLDYANEVEAGDAYKLRARVNSKIVIEELPGLLYYNQAVRKFNKGELWDSFNELQKAILFYRSPRIQEMMGLIIEAAKVSESVTEEQMQQMLSACLSAISLASN